MTRSSILPRRSISLASTYLLLLAVLLPIARPYLPGNTIWLDWANVVFLPLFWLQIAWRRRPVQFPLLGPMFLLFGASLIPLFDNISAERSLFLLFKEAYIYLWFLTMVNVIGKRLPKRLLTVFVISATAMALVAIGQWASPQFRRATTSFPQEVHRGIFLVGSNRPMGLFRNPIMLGNYLAFSVFLLVGSPLWRRKRLRWIVAGCLVGGVVASGSFGSVLALIAGASIVCWLRGRHLLAPAALVRLVVGIIVVGGAIFVLGGNLLQTEAGALFRQRYLMQRVERSYEARTTIWRPAIEGFMANPLGTGVGLFYHQEQARFRTMHNDYLAMLVERGVLGGIGTIWLLISIWRLIPPGGVRGVNSPSVTELCRVALVGALVAMLVSSLSANIFRFRHLWFLLFLLVQANESFKPLMNGRSVR